MALRDGMWSGSPCLIVGGGPSLRGLPRGTKGLEWAGEWPLPVGSTTDGYELRALPFVIAVNRAAESVNYPDLWLGIDSVYWRKSAPSRHSLDAPRVWVDAGDKKPDVDVILPCAARGAPNPHSALAWGETLRRPAPCYCPDCRNADRGTSRAPTPECKRKRPVYGIGCGGNSGFAALNLADILGADPIYLLGFDLKGENGVTANWHDGYRHTKPANESLYDRYLEAFRWAATKVRARVVVLETYQGASRLDCWEKKLAVEVL